jgi:hypothetical protein
VALPAQHRAPPRNDPAEFDRLAARVAAQFERTRDECCRECPKELLEAVLYHVHRRKPLPEDFRILGGSARLSDWMNSGTFNQLVEILKTWYPQRAHR